MAAYRRVYDSRHLQADCQEPGSALVIEYGLPFPLPLLMNQLCRPYDRRAASTTDSNPNIDLKPWPQTPFSLLLHKQYAISQYQHHQYMRAPAHIWASYTAVLSMSPGSEQTHVNCRLKVWLDCRQLCCPWSAMWTLPVLQWPLCEWVQCACIVYCGFSQKPFTTESKHTANDVKFLRYK